MRSPALPSVVLAGEGALHTIMSAERTDEARLSALLDAETDFVWRALRRLGLPPAEAEDASQRVWLVMARRLADVRPGSERAFLFRTAMNVAAHTRRGHARRPDRVVAIEPEEPVDLAPRPDEALDEERARASLDRVLAELPDDLRAVFVLYELEELTSREIAEALEIPPGSAASRLRRAREAFQRAIERLTVDGTIRGGLR